MINLKNQFYKYKTANVELFRQYNVLNLNTYNIYNIIDKSLFLEKRIHDRFTNNINIQKYYTHKHYDVNDQNGRTRFYEFNRKYFINYMKYIWALYSLTINFENFKNSLQNRYFVKNLNDVFTVINDLPEEIVKYIKKKYYTNQILNEDTNFDNLTIDYIMLFNNNNKIYSTHIEISSFERMFVEPITDNKYIHSNYISDPSFDGDKFFIDNKILTNIKKDDYKKKHKNGVIEHDISIINDEGNHFLLCLYEDEMLYEFNDNGEIINGVLT